MQRKALHRKLLALWQRGQSPYCDVRGSEIHGRGVYARCFIPKKTRICEYVGEIIDKNQSARRGLTQHAKSVETGDAAVYIFTLSKNFDIDGNVPWNTARLINHSCSPNCEAWIEGRRIFIHALRDIHPDEELTYDYGFDVDCYEEHPCRCGKPECVGHIVSREQWPELQTLLKTKRGKQHR
ncbi:MAG: SET domain-containing protein-lysine N-methyltransferase [Verrucomicrobia bacterium]|nr:SET domain-containing protein-lysine N-methyltransferase [Verrucomicrobiota bacterium]